jgi:large subunit ribosomal protein L21
MFAVIKIGNSQYLVSPNSEILVDSFSSAGSEVKFDQILMVSDKGNIQVGSPLVVGAYATAEILSQNKGEKVHIGKFKAKSRYRKTTGFRPKFTKIKISQIHYQVVKAK